MRICFQIGIGEILQIAALGNQFAVYRGKESHSIYVTGKAMTIISI